MIQRACAHTDSRRTRQAVSSTSGEGEDEIGLGRGRDLLLDGDRRGGLDGFAEELVARHDSDGEEDETCDEGVKVRAKHGL